MIYHQVAHQASPIALSGLSSLKVLETISSCVKLHQVTQSIFNQNLGFPDGWTYLEKCFNTSGSPENMLYISL